MIASLELAGIGDCRHAVHLARRLEVYGKCEEL